MSLIKSISGIRGTIGGEPGNSLTPVDIVTFTAAFGMMVKGRSKKLDSDGLKIVVGRDARVSGPMLEPLVVNTLRLMGINVISIGLATTPTVEMAVVFSGASAGIILTASHNPENWNALKLLNEKGEFLSDADGKELLSIAESGKFEFSGVEDLGKLEKQEYLRHHIKSITELPIVDVNSIGKAGFSVVVDAVNSVGGFAVPLLLNALGVFNVVCINCEPDGKFSHNPEPVPENLSEIRDKVREVKADLGIVVDPDVDRLALVCEDGSLFGEEYTLVAVADYVLGRKKGNTVSNMSSSMALRDITIKHGGEYFSSPVGEVNVVEKMKATGAVIGGEGNGGVIYPELHYGRDALLGIALFLSKLASERISMTKLREGYPDYFMVKKKVSLASLDQADLILAGLKEDFAEKEHDLRDGIKISYADSWVHVRKSNTEPIIRIYSESVSMQKADQIVENIIEKILLLRQS